MSSHRIPLLSETRKIDHGIPSFAGRTLFYARHTYPMAYSSDLTDSARSTSRVKGMFRIEVRYNRAFQFDFACLTTWLSA